ncbi:SDR family oxidoreductase [Sphingomonas sp. SUN019]|uniref:SDR family NAD(P)-dependent oxidoreductase n=1 Tax=Sphingomonas sp. SUN019 TaxID=2937788 RepID=UPI00216406FB|nr:SDR family NAD(P)-dependent oxidoreductase [Sphingomonas sp. SUN019]UVO50640.1 SDR family oxidoreductase [Sphingomonas sp. SUN019]
MSDFTGHHIVVTGASSGIGRATALLLASRGAKMSLIARRAETLAAVRELAGGETFAAPADVSDRAALLGAIDAAEAALGPIDGLFANAGTGGTFAAFTEYDDAVFEDVLRTNLLSPFWAMKRVLPGMIERRRGAILVTGSLASERGMARNPGYVASKHGVLGLARAAALEVAPHGVRVNCIVPGFVETEMLANIPYEARATMAARVPQRRTGSAEEVAEVAAFMLSDAAAHVTGQSWAVDGGILNTLTV